MTEGQVLQNCTVEGTVEFVVLDELLMPKKVIMQSITEQIKEKMGYTESIVCCGNCRYCFTDPNDECGYDKECTLNPVFHFKVKEAAHCKHFKPKE